MKIERHYIGRETPSGFRPCLTTYILDRTEGAPLRPMVVIFPGGGYMMKAENWEGERVALEYNRAGFNAAVVDYPVSPDIHPYPLIAAAEAMCFVRENSEKLGIRKEMVVALGFSAGGHLAASLSTLWNKGILEEYGIDPVLARPDASVLCYPVITTGKGTHIGSIENLTGTSDSESKEWKLLSLEDQVDSMTPPAFLWHTYEDSVVGVENSLSYAFSLRENGVPFELHIFGEGDHGLSLATEELVRTRSIFRREYRWLDLSVDWICSLFHI
ncbi:MAG: alpha/beta hydrolase [Candidatus Ornithospirochaeta sp.]